MNNQEVKEILNYLKKKENTRRIKCITIEESKQLLYYITDLEDTLKDREEYCYGLETQLTNLQEENERLKQPQIFIDTMDMEERYGQELYEDYLKEQLEEYKQRNEKAIEILKLCNSKCAKETINILKGDK